MMMRIARGCASTRRIGQSKRAPTSVIHDSLTTRLAHILRTRARRKCLEQAPDLEPTQAQTARTDATCLHVET